MVNAYKTLKLDDGEWNFYNEEQLGLSAVTYYKKDTGVTLAEVLSNPKKRVAAHVAWSGARHSRAPGDTIEILVEMGEKGVDPDEKLETTFRGYGHASVADMARLSVQFNNVPMHVPMNLFNDTYVNSGQEKSTRYQKQFSGVIMHPLILYLPQEVRKESFVNKLNKEFESLGALALENFNILKPKITEAYEKFFKPETNADKSALNTRVLDTVRFNLLLGQCSGFALETSARDWARIISHLKASPINYYNNIGIQLEKFLAPGKELESTMGFRAEAPSLIEFTEADNTFKSNISAIKEFYNSNIHISRINSKFKGFEKQNVQILDNVYSSGLKMAAQYMLNLFPDTDYNTLLRELYSMPNEKKTELSKIIFNRHNHQKELPPQFATTSDITIIFEGTLGELRDFNRHRAWGRFMQHIPIYFGEETSYNKAISIMNKGFGLPLYMNIPEFKNLREEMRDRLEKYYSKAFNFMEKSHKLMGDVPYDFFINILPLAARSNIWMHGNPKQANYLTNLRVRPGGHINYRVLTYNAAKKLSENDPFLKGLELSRERPDPADRKEFFNRT